MEKTKERPSVVASAHLLHRSQFILGPSFADDFPSWQRTRLNAAICLTVHPDLLISQAAHEDKSITLLGFMIDPDDPQANDSDLVGSLVRSFSSFDVLLERTAKIGGRWIVIASDEHKVRLFNDTFGLRQVFYTDSNHTNELWCASQPGLIGKTLDLQMDGEAVDFMNWFKLRENGHCWPGDSSPYREVKRLLPNHCLNLDTGQCYRYWPNKGLEGLAPDEAVEKASRVLSGLMQSASNRFDLALGMSSGWDSRLVLASCRDVRQKISYYSVTKPDIPRSHPDVKVPSRLLPKLGLEHKIFASSPKLRSEFEETFSENMPFAQTTLAPRMQSFLDYHKLRRVAVVGNASETARCDYNQNGARESHRQTTAETLTRLARMKDHPFAVRSFERWLEGLGQIYNFNVIDLFMWEWRNGNWLATRFLHYDIAWQDIFTPYNTRSLMVALLSVDEQFRRPPANELYYRLIHRLWPEVLREPINPPDRRLGYLISRGVKSAKRHIRSYARPLKRRFLQ